MFELAIVVPYPGLHRDVGLGGESVNEQPGGVCEFRKV